MYKIVKLVCETQEKKQSSNHNGVTIRLPYHERLSENLRDFKD